MDRSQTGCCKASPGKLFKIFLLMIAFAGLTIGTAFSQSTWNAPASSNQLKNPLQGNSVATEKGKKLYKQLCAICHGDKGKGDGMAGMALKPRPADFSSSSIQAQSDGALYWKLTEGKPPMASYKTVLSEEERWQLVNFIRTMKR
jgi:mono/diheme cytochrome c family protein